jgi:myo-inositol 2-dehydrogenase / D-chiro-inositol 1-dehydrogenase
MDRVRVCVVGAGRAGMVHANNYRRHLVGAELVALVEAEPARSEQAAAELGIEATYPDVRTALDRLEFDAVVITTPTFTHAEIAVAAARAGKHVFCEKPMALTAGECDRMIEAAASANVILQIGFMRRFDPPFVDAFRQIQEGAIGEVMRIHTMTRGPGLPPRWACDLRTSNGMLAEASSHDFDTMRWLGGADLAHVYAEAATYKCHDLKKEFPDFYDNALVNVRLMNGVMGIIDTSVPVDYGYDARAEVLGTKGVMFIGELRQEALVVCTRDGGLVEPQFTAWRDRFREAYLAEARHFVECIVQGAKPLVGGIDGKKAVEGVVAANESIQRGAPVALDGALEKAA